MGSPASSFDLLDPALQRWVIRQGWEELRGIQTDAISAVAGGPSDVLLIASTASGKTEAAFLPLLSDYLAQAQTRGFFAIYVAPLKALIDDQFERLTSMGEEFDLPVHRSHGDVSQSARQRFLENPGGVLLITPESLEALLARRGNQIVDFFPALHYVVIDEVHAFMGTERGVQLLSLLQRISYETKHRARRVGLSATVGKPESAAMFLAGGEPSSVVLVQEAPQPTRLDLSFRTHHYGPQEKMERALSEIAVTLFRDLYTTDNLVFANSRANVELLTSELSGLCVQHNLPNHFFPHHANLSTRSRRDAEDELRDATEPTTVICTSTLELGVDIGSVQSVAQIGPPPSANSLRQRLGRSGRRGEPAVLRYYVPVHESDSIDPVEQLSLSLLQSVASLVLVMNHHYESAPQNLMSYSTLVQQVLSFVAQRGGATLGEMVNVFSGPGAFPTLTLVDLEDLIKGLCAHDLLDQSNGEFVVGEHGERELGNFRFYAAFTAEPEWTLVTVTGVIGTFAPPQLPRIGQRILFGGRNFRVRLVDATRHRVELESVAAGGIAPYGGLPVNVSTLVRQQMLRLLETEDSFSWLDSSGQSLLRRAREQWRAAGFDSHALREVGGDTQYVPWVGTACFNTVTSLLRREGISFRIDGISLWFSGLSISEVRQRITSLLNTIPEMSDELMPFLDPDVVVPEKWEWCLPERLAQTSQAQRCLDLPGALLALSSLVTP